MRKELSESVKMSLIHILNQNIRLDEAVKTENSSLDSDTSGSGMPGGIPERKDKTIPSNKSLDWNDVLMGKQSKMLDMDPTKALGLAAGGKLAGFAGRALGSAGAQAVTNMFGGGKGIAKLGGGLGNIFGKVASDIETLSGGPGMEAQIGDIARAQVTNRLQGAGYTPQDGWFRFLVPQTGVKPIEPETAEETAAKTRAARQARIQDVKLSQAEKKYGLPSLP
jgi:hypothetical protein